MRFRRIFPAIPWLAAKQAVGGQAVMEGVMMRRGSRLAIAVRKADGKIKVETLPWFSLMRREWLKKPFVRGFPVLVETLVNGVKALNYSAVQALDEGGDEGESSDLGPWALASTVAFALVMAVALFVVVPHLASVGLAKLGLAGGVQSLSFHVWDGLIKLAVFLAYIRAIAFVRDIKRVFQYHGAEHKAIWAFEAGAGLTPETARSFSRLHPRCGTTFLLFVLALSILIFAVAVPAVLAAWSPQAAWLRHAYAISIKMALMVPVSAAGYELIKLSGRIHHTFWGRLLAAPGLCMQRMTTFEPDDSQIEVAIAALNGALGEEG